MIFGEVLEILRINSSYTHSSNRSEYVLEIFSALCGESDPLVVNYSDWEKHDLIGSPKLPDALRNNEPSNRNKLYHAKKLTKPIQIYVRRNAKEDTFTDYLDNVVSSECLPILCKALKIPETYKPYIVFKIVYEYFLKIAYGNTDDSEEIIADIIKTIASDMKPNQTENITSPDNNINEAVSKISGEDEGIFAMVEKKSNLKSILPYRTYKKAHEDCSQQDKQE